VWALRDINLEVQQGEVLGIIGKNGAGKSTLLKLLSRVTAPTTGRIRARGR
jgi:lipopolysaccharide transport system ATP-binding protein